MRMMIDTPQQARRILVIDDNPDIHKDYRKILESRQEDTDFEALDAFFGVEEKEPTPQSSNVQLDSAFQGEEGLQKVVQAIDEGFPYAMAFVDMRMPPGWDGLQTIEEMWKVSPDLQVVICTAYSDNTWDDIIDRVGRSDKLLILKKPFDRIEVNQLAVALTEKWALAKKARMRQEDLEQLVHERTLQLQHAALHDPLTDLGNRAMFHDDLTKTLQRQTDEGIEAAICLVDLDRFKQVNDTLGHPIGDELLIAVAQRLRSCFRKEDSIARLGGDEFAILCSNAKGVAKDDPSSRFSTASLQRVQEQMCEPYLIDGQRIMCGISMGVALIPDDGDSAEEVLHKADLALYLAKHVGRGQFCMFDAAAKSALVTSRELSAEISLALKENQFELYYQPLVNSETAETECLEALIRWQHPGRGLVYPGDFIAAAEHSGQILDIGQWVLQQACKDAVNWPSSIRLAVNVSAVQFRDASLEAIIVQALEDTGLSPGRLEIELTESVALQEYDEMMETLNSLRARGIRIVLDDFGTGHSSLSYLRQFQFDKLKPPVAKIFVGWIPMFLQ